MTDIRPGDVVTTGGTQSRASISEDTVANYAEAIQNGALLPPIVVYHDGTAYWLADGFHRLMAYARLGVEWVPADVRQGARRDAVLYSVGANSDHGLPRTNADKRHAVMLLLNDEEWAAWSNREIASRCAVNPSLVDKMRKEISLPTNGSEPTPKTYTTKHGTVATMRTENIGRDRGRNGTKAEKIEQIRGLAGDGFRASQIAPQVNLTEAVVRQYATEGNVTLPDHLVGPVRKIDGRRVIEQTVDSMDACAQSINAVPVDFSTISKEDATEWAEAVAESLTIFRRFHNKLKEAANV